MASSVGSNSSKIYEHGLQSTTGSGASSLDGRDVAAILDPCLDSNYGSQFSTRSNVPTPTAPEIAPLSPIQSTALKTNKVATPFFRLIAGTLAAIPVMAAAVPITIVLWIGQYFLAKPILIVAEKILGQELTGAQITAKKSFLFAMSFLVGCGGKMIIGSQNKYGQAYRLWDHIVESKEGRGSITLGSIPTTVTRGSIIKELGINTRIIDMTEREAECITTLMGGTPTTPEEWQKLEISYVNYQAKDFIPLEIDLINKAVEDMHTAVSEGKNVYIHCKAGVGRSATILAAYLAKYGANESKPMSAKDAIQYIEEKRFINLNKEQKAKVAEFKAMLEIIDKASSDKKPELGNQLANAIKHEKLDLLTDNLFDDLKTAINDGTKKGKKPDLKVLQNLSNHLPPQFRAVFTVENERPIEIGSMPPEQVKDHLYRPLDLQPLSLAETATLVKEIHDNPKHLHIFCKDGSESATLLAAYLTQYETDGKKMSAINAFKHIENKKPLIRFSKKQKARVILFEVALQNSASPKWEHFESYL